jgi:hypothetical protein
MSDIVRRLLKKHLQPIPAEEQSGADRLRPPYDTPLTGANAATAGASRDLEVGFKSLPGAYRRALSAAPVSPVDVGTMPSGYNTAGFLYTGPQLQRPGMLVNSANNASHELVHELGRRTGNPWKASVEELLAQLVSKQRPWLDDSAVDKVDSEVRQQHAEPAQNRLDFWIKKLGFRRDN